MLPALSQPPLTLYFSQFYQHLKEKSTDRVSSLLILMALLGDKELHFYLADDDEDDKELFIEALHDVAPKVKITDVSNGTALMKKLSESGADLPDMIFLDLNMPQKNGIECLEELRGNKKFNKIPIIIYSTSVNLNQIDQTYKKGANLYVQKPQHFSGIKNLLHKMLSLRPAEYLIQPHFSKFVLA